MTFDFDRKVESSESSLSCQNIKHRRVADMTHCLTDSNHLTKEVHRVEENKKALF